MSSVTANADIVEFLRPLETATEIHDAEGNLVGVFAPCKKPPSDVAKRLYRLVGPADLDRVRNSSRPTHSFDEVIAHLTSLETP
jgi:hypothetical protein